MVNISLKEMHDYDLRLDKNWFKGWEIITCTNSNNREETFCICGVVNPKNLTPNLITVVVGTLFCVAVMIQEEMRRAEVKLFLFSRFLALPHCCLKC